ncbi:MAG TPA: DUF4236 domain-containing protein [Candidatus Baltobacteraceae bacterium]|nr:DUF4236 domain-containing protein [Candidatus Baltobacteraceae bacterium]
MNSAKKRPFSIQAMGFYIRKSISVGPFRFNLSKSGVGLSTGVKGFRVGTGPRGNYVHMGRGGLYFRTAIPGPQSHQDPPSVSQTADDDFQALEAGTVSQMVDSSSAQLLDEINSKARRPSLWLFALALSFVLTVLSFVLKAPMWLTWLIVFLSVSAIPAAAYWDNLKKSVVLFYSMEPAAEDAYQGLHTDLGAIQSCSRTWQIPAERQISGIYDWKTHSGVNSVIKRRLVNVSNAAPPYFKTNIAIPMLPAERLKFYFLPDRLLVYDSGGVGAVNYTDLDVSWQSVQFHEEQFLPPDAKVLGQTWRFVNKSGGPDRRFNNNTEIPIVLYEQIQLASRSGLSETFMCSRVGVAAQLKKAILAMITPVSAPASLRNDDFAVCPCNNCAGHIEFPTRGVGQTVKCPFCGMDTVLFVPPNPV